MGKDELKNYQQLNHEDSLLVRLEKMCVDFMKALQKFHTFQIKLTSMTLDNNFNFPG